MAGAPLRIGLLIFLAPRKRGSLEDWLIHVAAEAGRRGHRIDVFGAEPIRADIRADLEATGGTWNTVEEIMRAPWQGRRRLAGYDVLHVNLFSTRSPVTMLALSSWPARVLFVDHASRRTSGTGFRAMLGSVLDRALMRRAAGVAGVSRFITELDRARMRIDHPRLRTIYNGVDVERFVPPSVGRNPADGLKLITASQLIPEKGVQHVVEAMAQLPAKFRLEIAGDGAGEPALRALADELNVGDRVSFLGVRSDLHELYRDASIYVHPATWQEAFGISIVEAMASGCAVVASEVGAIPELVQHERTGLIVPPGDVDALRKAVLRLSDEPGLLERLAAGARERAARDFTIERCVGEHLDWCEELASGKSRHGGGGGASAGTLRRADPRRVPGDGPAARS